jgi:hypothetical protein
VGFVTCWVALVNDLIIGSFSLLVPFIIVVSILTAINVLLVVATPSDIPALAPFLDIMQLMPMPTSARIQLLAIALINCILALLSERYLWPVVAGWIGLASKVGQAKEGAAGNKKIWKSVERDMRIS